MSHVVYELALIRRDELLREAAERRLATVSAAGEAADRWPRQLLRLTGRADRRRNRSVALRSDRSQWKVLRC